MITDDMPTALQEPATLEQLDEIKEACERAYRNEVLYGTEIFYVPGGRGCGRTLLGLGRLRQRLIWHRRRWGWVRGELLKALKHVR